MQVADRWHLLRNLGDAVQALGARYNAAARRAAQHVRVHLALFDPTKATRDVYAFPPAPTATQRASMVSQARRDALCDEALRLRAIGASVTRISAELGKDRKTILGWLRLGHAPKRPRAKSDSILDPYKTFLGRRWIEGCRNATQLWREIVDLGFRGRPSIVREWVKGLRGTGTRRSAVPGEPLPPIWPVPSGYGLARLLMISKRHMNSEERLFTTHLFTAEPALDVAIKWARRMNSLLRRRTNEDLSTVLSDAIDTPLAGFAAGLRRDFDAIDAAVKSPWTTSPVEGHVCRVKMLKRSMYGRAGFELLRARVLS